MKASPEAPDAVLQAQAARIPDEAARRSFLKNVPWHWAIGCAPSGTG